MLFDLRSRGRRRTVQFVYLGLAVLMGGGLILFGVGAGNGNGGLLNAFTGGGAGNSQGAVISQAEKTALKQTRANPSDAAAWGALLQARWSSASSNASASGQFTAAGRKELQGAAYAWEKYSALTKTADPALATLAAEAYGALANYPAEASAWEIEAAANPSAPHGYECLAAASYAAKETRKGDLALAKALSLVPKLSQATLKQQIEAAKTTPSVAQSC